MAEIYRNGNNLVLAESGRTSLHYGPDTVSATYAGAGELFLNAGNLRMATSTASGRVIEGWSLGAHAGTAGEIWHNYNNGKDRLYAQVSTTKFGYIPFPILRHTFTASATTDGNNLGGQLKRVWYHPGSGTSMTTFPDSSNSILYRYLNIGSGNVYIPLRISMEFWDITLQTGTRSFSLGYAWWDEGGTSTTTYPWSGVTPNTFSAYIQDFNPLTATMRAPFGHATARFEARIDHNNFGFASSWSFDYVVVPSTYVGSRLIY